MSKDNSEKKERKEKKEKKEKRAETDGVKKSKKEKKDKKEVSGDVTTALLNKLETEKPGSVAIDQDGDVVIADAEDAAPEFPETATAASLVPFANPLADEKQTKKILKAVKKSSKNKTLKRGVKEVIKAVRKSPTSAPSSTFTDSIGVVVLAADISPPDVISHIPVLCEDHNIPYIYVTSRAALGESSNTKRPTSVVLISKAKTTKGKDDKEVDSEWNETYAELVKLVEKATKGVKI